MLVSGSLRSDYINTVGDIREYIPSGNLVLGDGTSGGGPISSINYGLPTQIVSQTMYVSGIEGYSLSAAMNYFPEYSRISTDKAAIAAQILSPISIFVDDVYDKQILVTAERAVTTYPLQEQGVVYEWDYNTTSNILNRPIVEARLGSSWFDLPLTESEDLFWKAPITRVETTNCEISGLELLPSTLITNSGLNSYTLSNEIPLHNRIYIEISGASNFVIPVADDTDRNTALELNGYIRIKGIAAGSDRLNRNSIFTETIPVVSNGFHGTNRLWQKIISIESFNVDPTAYIKVIAANNNALVRPNSLTDSYELTRDSTPRRTFFKRTSSNTEFYKTVQLENTPTFTSSDDFWLARCILNSDTFYDKTVEVNILDFTKITDSNGTALSGIMDFDIVPWSNYGIALDNQSNLWIFDTYKQSLDMSAYQETVQSPVRIEMSYPKHSSETPSEFTVKLHTLNISESYEVERFRWLVHHDDTSYIINNDTEYPVSGIAGWQYLNDEIIDIASQSYTISGTGQYTFELDCILRNNDYTKTYTALNIEEKKALNSIPINGLSANPSGLFFDGYERLWITDGQTAVRLVTRNDIATWVDDERVLLTREDYDETRIK